MSIHVPGAISLLDTLTRIRYCLLIISEQLLGGGQHRVVPAKLRIAWTEPNCLQGVGPALLVASKTDFHQRARYM